MLPYFVVPFLEKVRLRKNITISHFTSHEVWYTLLYMAVCYKLCWYSETLNKKAQDLIWQFFGTWLYDLIKGAAHYIQSSVDVWIEVKLWSKWNEWSTAES